MLIGNISFEQVYLPQITQEMEKEINCLAEVFKVEVPKISQHKNQRFINDSKFKNMVLHQLNLVSEIHTIPKATVSNTIYASTYRNVYGSKKI